MRSLQDMALTEVLRTTPIKVTKVTFIPNDCHTKSVFNLQLPNGLILYGRKQQAPIARLCKKCVSLVPQMRCNAPYKKYKNDHRCIPVIENPNKPNDHPKHNHIPSLQQLALQTYSMKQPIEVKTIEIPRNGTLNQALFTIYIERRRVITFNVIIRRTITIKGTHISSRQLEFCVHCHKITNMKRTRNDGTKYFKMMLNLHFRGWEICHLCAEDFYYSSLE